MGQLKEADFLRWGNTKRMTGLRKAEQDGMWEGIKERSSMFFCFVFRFLLPCSIAPTCGSPNVRQLSGRSLQITLMTTGA